MAELISTSTPDLKVAPGPERVYTRSEIRLLRLRRAVLRPEPWLGFLGLATFFGGWHLAAVLDVPGVNKLESPMFVLREFLLPPRGTFDYNPQLESKFGYGVWGGAWYTDIMVSVWRICRAFLLSLLGIPLGLLMGWRRRVREFVFPTLELLRPVPPVAWVPLAIVMLPWQEAPVIFICSIASFFVVTLNTALGVDSIDPVYFRAARCLGFSEAQILRQVVIPGAMPFIFTGMILGLGVAWFSLVGGEIIAATWGLGYRIWESYTSTSIPPLLIAMFTSGLIGLAMSLMLRGLQRRVLVWKRRAGATL